MIIDHTYFKGEIYIPSAKPSVTDQIGLDSDFIYTMERYEEECMIKILGETLYRELLSKMDLTQSNLIAEGQDPESIWDNLINGATFVDNGVTKYWKGLRFKTPLNSSEYNRSLLAYYVYFYYHRVNFTATTTTGEKLLHAANAKTENVTRKVVVAWNTFCELVRGRLVTPKRYYKNGLLGVDYYPGTDTVSLYEFIDFSNRETVVYPNLIKANLENMNAFNL